MPNYVGRFVQQMFTKNFGGIDSKATVLNIKDNEAEDIINFDIGIDGSLTRRRGWSYVVESGFAMAAPTNIAFWMPFFDENGDKFYFQISNGTGTAGTFTMWDSTLPQGPYTGRGTTAFTLGVTDRWKFIGANWKGAVLIANGVDAPVYYKQGGTAQTLKEASKLADPTSITAYRTAGTHVTSNNYAYGVAAISPRGETKLAVVNEGLAPLSITLSDYILLSWEPVAGASGYRIYWMSTDQTKYGDRNSALSFSASAGDWIKIADLPATTLSYGDDVAAIANSMLIHDSGTLYHGISPNTVNDAYRTPSDWETNGPPTGVAVVVNGRDERAFWWRDQYVWVSAQSDPLDYLQELSSFVFNIDGGEDREITSIGNLYDYILVFTKTQTFVYTGSSADVISLVKMVGRGCLSHKSVVNIEGDLYFWSNYGPTSFKRIMAGADISSSTDFNKRVQNKLFTQTNVSEWKRICAYRYIPENRVVWAVPGLGQTQNTLGYVFQFDVNAWSTYDNWTFCNMVTDNSYETYGVTEGANNHLVLINTGNTDGESTPITATYWTGWYDMRSWDTRKRLVWADVVVDREVGNYTFQTYWSWDYNRSTSDPVVCTQTTTDGATIETTSSVASAHRVFADGLGNAFQLVFTTSATTPLKILGWRPEIRGKGVR